MDRIILFTSLYAVILIPGIMVLLLMRDEFDKKVKYIVPLLLFVITAMLYKADYIRFQDFLFQIGVSQTIFTLITCLFADVEKQFKKLSIPVYALYITFVNFAVLVFTMLILQ